MLASLKARFSKGINSVAGNTTYLKAVCAACALVAAADGDISDEEVQATIDSVKNQ